MSDSHPTAHDGTVRTTMRAAQFHAYGSPDVITTATVPVPLPGPRDIQVRVGATTVNGTELALREGRYRLLSGRRFPKGLGVEFAGTVTATGTGVAEFRVGDLVWGVLDYRKTSLAQSPIGAAAEYLTVAASRTAHLPTGLAFGDAVAMISGSTALSALRDKARLQPGERLLVRGGTGGVGYLGVQLGRALGAHVTALVSTPNLGVALELGADTSLDYRTTRPEDLGRFDVIFDTVGSQMLAYRKHLTPHGRMVSITFQPMLAGIAATAASTIHGRRRIRFFSGNPTPTLHNDYATYIQSGDVRALIKATYNLDEVAAAHLASETSGGHGKQIIAP
jgi:NADPH:quinone reductase-like Zn-dependent oxidoreductase